MKKLMFGIAAIFAGICLADVSSANVVGYANTSTTAKKYLCFSTQFL